MKKLLTFFALLLLVVSCTKETDVSLGGDTSSDVVSFTASVVDMTSTKSTLINSWSGGEEVALFVDGDDAVYRFTIAADGTMSGDGVIVDREESYTYTAFYPYDSDLSTIEAYESACTAGEVDYMKATTTTSGADVNLQFEHQMAALSFTIMIGETITNPAISFALDGDFGSATALKVETTTSSYASKLVSNYFVEADTDISSAMIKVEYSGSTTFHSIAQDYTATLEVGKQYPFSCTIGEFSTGSGTEDSPFVIYTADDMRKVGTDTVDWALSSHYILAWDIELGDVEFTAIGTETSPFTGTFDGNGRKISGLSITDYETNNIGLFGYISSATIKNVGVDGDVYGNNNVGSIVGTADNSSIENCYNLATVGSGNSSCGGIVGYVTSSSTVSNCYNRGSLSGLYNVGGIAGGISESYITYCYNTGTIKLMYYDYYDSGIVHSFSNSTVSCCYYDSDEMTSSVAGAVNGSNDGTNYCGLTTEMMNGDATTEGTLLYYFAQGGSTSWVADTNNINNGYPILTWQTSNN